MKKKVLAIINYVRDSGIAREIELMIFYCAFSVTSCLI